MRDRKSTTTSGRPRTDGPRPDKHRATVDNNTLEEQCHPRKIFIGGLAHKTTTQHLREHFASFGGIVDAVVLRWPDGRSRGFGYVTFADVVAASAVLAKSHVLGGREVDVKRAVPGTNKLFIGGLPQNTTANELREHFEKFGAVSDAVVMIDPATGRSRGFGFVCFLPGEEGAAAVTFSLEKYDEHRLRGKWIEVKSAAPPHKLAKTSSQDEPSLPAGGQGSSSRRQSEEISLAGALPCSSDPSPSPSVENREPNQQKPVKALGSPRKVMLPTDNSKNCARSLPPGLIPPRQHNESMVEPDDMQSQQLPWWPTQPWNPMFASGFGFSGLPVDHPGHCGSRVGMPFYAADSWNTHIAGVPTISPAEGLQRSLESFVREAMKNKMECGVTKSTPSVSTACSATTEMDTSAPFCFDI